MKNGFSTIEARIVAEHGREFCEGQGAKWDSITIQPVGSNQEEIITFVLSGPEVAIRLRNCLKGGGVAKLTLFSAEGLGAKGKRVTAILGVRSLQGASFDASMMNDLRSFFGIRKFQGRVYFWGGLLTSYFMIMSGFLAILSPAAFVAAWYGHILIKQANETVAAFPTKEDAEAFYKASLTNEVQPA